jgi:hypothetical protein
MSNDDKYPNINLSDAEREALDEAEAEGEDGELKGDDGADVTDTKAGAAAEKPDEAKPAEDASKPAEQQAVAAAASVADAGKPAAIPAVKADYEVIPPLRLPEVALSREIPKAADLDANMKAVEKELAELDKKLDDGEIETKDYHRELRKLSDRRQDIRDMQSEIGLVSRTNESARVAAWRSAQDQFYDKNPDFKSSILQGALDASLRNLYAQPKYAGADYLWLLNRAAADVNAAIGRNAPAAPPAGEPPAGGKPAPKATDAAARQAANAQRAAADRKSVPTTLGGLPQAGVDAPGGDEFSHLDGLAGMELENALSRMTPEQQSKYLSM